MSSATPKFVKQQPDDSFLLKWLRDYKLEHLYETLRKSRVNIEELCELDEEILLQTASYRLKLKGTDSISFTSALKTYHNLQLLSKRNLEISSCIDNLEFTKNELTIKQRNNVIYVQEKFKKIMRTLKKRENILIREISKKSENKVALLNEQILHLNKYKNKLESQYHILSNNNENIENNNQFDVLSDEENIEYGKLDLNMNTNILLNDSIQYDKDRFANINNMSVEIPNYDDIIKQIKRTGVVIDEFYINEDPPFDNKIDDKLDCLCGTQLMLTKVKDAYAPKHKIYCNFCTNYCHLNTDIYHCPLGDVKLHPGGFDLCYFCGSRCFEARLADKRREKDEKRRQRKRNAKSNVLDSVNKTYRRKRPNAPNNKNNTKAKPIRHHRSYSEMKSNQWEQNRNDNFEYNQPLKQLIDMGYDQKKSKQLLLKHKGNITKAMGELMM